MKLCGGFFGLIAAVVTAAFSTPPLFVKVPAADSGLAWTHDNAASDAHYLPETLGPGVAFVDYNADGWPDIFLVNSGPSDFFKPKSPLRNALYKNNCDGTFSDVTDKAGVQGVAFGMGVAAGDYDNDGFPDLFITAYGRTTLYRNRGNGTFEDVTEKAGLVINGWTTSSAWFDFDGDGLLDLFVGSFVEFGLDKHVSCGDNKLGKPFYCVPTVFKPTSSYLFRNKGDGTFSNVGQNTAIAKNFGKALGVVASDINNDGRMDLFVANDTVQNFLFLNRGDRWEERGLAAEVALSADGKPRSGMGVDAADFDGDGWEDLFVANIDQEMFSLYRNNGDESFVDAALEHGVAQATRKLSGWGLRFFDFDNDGQLDLFLANGHPDDMIESHTPGVSYREPLLLFRNDKRRLMEISSTSGPAFAENFSARGLATGDYNNDGRVDVLIGVNGGAPVLLRNLSGNGNHWIGLKLVGKVCNRDAVGARVTWSKGGVRRSMLKTGGGSYLSSHDQRVVIGLGAVQRPDWIEVQWPRPSKRVERFQPPTGRYSTLIEGEGSMVDAN